MNYKCLAIAASLAWIATSQIYAQCGTTCSGPDATKIKFYGAANFPIDQTGVVTAAMGLKDKNVATPGPFPGLSFVITDSNEVDMVPEEIPEDSSEPGTAISGTLTASNAGNFTGSGGWAYGFFEPKKACGLRLEVRSKKNGAVDYGAWQEANSLTVEPSYDLATGYTIKEDYQIRFRRKVEQDSDGKSNAGDGGGVNAGVSPPSIPEEQQDVAPVVSTDPPAQILPAGFHSTLPMGATATSAGFNTGSLALTGAVSASLPSLANLRVRDPEGDGLSVIRDAGNIRQVSNTERLADVQTISGGGFAVRFYQNDAFGSVQVGGLYPINSGAVPSLTVSYTPVAAQGDHLGGVRITSTGPNQVAYVEDFLARDSAGTSWRVISGGGLQTVQHDTFFSFVAGKWQRTDITETFRESQLFSKQQQTYVYQVVREGSPSEVSDSEEFLIEEVVFDTSATSRTTTWMPDAVHLGSPASVTYPDGSWEAYRYYDGSGSDPSLVGMLKEILRPWNGSPTLASAATSSNSESTVIVYAAPLTTPGPGMAHQVYSRTTMVPGSTVPVKQWVRNLGGSTSSMINVLDYAEVSSQWLPDYSDIISESGSTLASGTESISSSSYTYSGSHVPEAPWIDSSFGSLDAAGNGSVTGYEMGTYNPGSGSFTPNPTADASHTDVRATTVNLKDGWFPAPFEASKVVEITDIRGKLLCKELWIMDKYDNWNKATTTTYEYPTLWSDGTAREVIVKHDGRVISHTNVTAGVSTITTSVIDEQGIETKETRDLLGRTVSSMRVGVAAGSGTLAQPDVITVPDYSGRTTTTTVTAGTLSRSQTSTEDLAGRTISETDAQGAITLTTYPNGGRDTRTELPGGRIRLVTRAIDGNVTSVTGSAVVEENYQYGVLSSGNKTTTRRVGTGASSPRYVTTETDWAGRVVNVTSPSPTGSGTVASISAYGWGTYELASVAGPAGTTLFSHPDTDSSRTLTGLDMNADGEITAVSPDRASESLDYYLLEDGYWWQVSTSKTYDVNGDDASAITSTSKRCLFGQPGGYAEKSVSISPTRLTLTSVTAFNRTTRTRTDTEQSNASTQDAVTVNLNGLVVAANGHDSATSSHWEYNGFGQPIRETSARGEVTRRTYHPDGSLETVIDHSNQTTTYAYYGKTTASAGMLESVEDALGKTTTYQYSSQGKQTEIGGSAAYPVSYSYDEFGAMETMTTKYGSGSLSQVTKWVFQPGTGLLTTKLDAALKPTGYTYDAAGRINIRTWARGVTTTYGYNGQGDLTGIDYSDATPDVSMPAPDRLGRPTTIIQTGVGTETRTYQAGKGVESARFYNTGHLYLSGKGLRHTEPNSNGMESGFLETSGATVVSDGTVARTIVYSYVLGRLSRITDGTQRHDYDYDPASSLVTAIRSGPTAGADWFKERRFYDTRSRLVGIRGDRMSGNTVTAAISSHAYDYDALNRRSLQTLRDGSTVTYGYNDRSEVESATRKNSAGTAVPVLNTGYTYDAIGNRLTSSSDILGDHGYTPDSRNRYASITTGNGRSAVGRAPAGWTVQVAGTNASRNGELYWRGLTAANTSAPVWQSVVTRRDTGTPTTTNRFWYAQTPTTPSYDDDGNLTDDGRWTYAWDAENRLIQMETTNSATIAGHPYTKLQFGYDFQGRRVARHVWQNGTQAVPTFKTSHRWLYDGWNVITEFTAPSATSTALTRVNTLTWGLDLSGSLQGAGGVGGLLVQTAVTGGVIERASYDGNGNITAWTKSNASAPTSRREYDAFGNTQVSEGITPCTFGFSTKMQDVETGLYYYGYRFYDPVMGRWLNRDPIAEKGGLNLFAFIGNSGISRIDVLGNAPLGWYAVDVYIRKRGSRIGHFDPTSTLTAFHASLEFYGRSAGVGPSTEFLSPIITTDIVSSPDQDYDGEKWDPKSKRSRRLWIDNCCIDEKKLKANLEKVVDSMVGQSTGAYVAGFRDCSDFPSYVVEKAIKDSRNYKTWLCYLSSSWAFYDVSYNGQ